MTPAAIGARDQLFADATLQYSRYKAQSRVVLQSPTR